jgi:hypothetical protein
MLSCSVPIFCLVFLILPNGWLLLCVSNVPGCDVSDVIVVFVILVFKV